MKSKIILYCLLIAVGAAAMYQFGPRQTVSVTETVTKDKVVTVVREVKSPDGSVVRDERTERESRTDSQVQVPVVQAKPDWMVGVNASPVVPGHYQATIGRRVLGNAYISASGDTHGTILLGVTILF